MADTDSSEHSSHEAGQGKASSVASSESQHAQRAEHTAVGQHLEMVELTQQQQEDLTKDRSQLAQLPSKQLGQSHSVPCCYSRNQKPQKCSPEAAASQTGSTLSGSEEGPQQVPHAASQQRQAGSKQKPLQKTSAMLQRGAKRMLPGCMQRPHTRAEFDEQEQAQQAPAAEHGVVTTQQMQQQAVVKGKVHSCWKPLCLQGRSKRQDSSEQVQHDAELSAAEAVSEAQQAVSPLTSSRKRTPFKGFFKHKMDTAGVGKQGSAGAEMQQEAVADDLIAAVRAPSDPAQQIDVQAEMQQTGRGTAPDGVAQKVSLADLSPAFLSRTHQLLHAFGAGSHCGSTWHG